MSEHLSVQLLEGYRQRALAPTELLALDDHLATCATCRRELRKLQPTRAALQALRQNLQVNAEPTSAHLPEAQLQAYTNGQLTEIDRELAESHLEFCPQCAAQAQELSARAAPPTRWAKFAAALKIVPLSLRVAGIAAATLLLIIAAALWWRAARDKSELFVQRPTPTLAPSPTAIPQPSAPPLFALDDGGKRLTLDAEGNLTGLESLAPTEQQRVRAALTSKRVELPAFIAALSGRRSELMGGDSPDSFQLISPLATAVATNRPRLRWQRLLGALSYEVTIYNTNFDKVAASGPLTVTNWTPSRLLARGGVYRWQVVAQTGSGSIKAPSADEPEAKFKVLEQAQAAEITRARTAYAGQHLLLGLSYAEAGLLDEAEDELQVLVRANPGSPVAKDLLRSLRARRRAK